MASEGKKDKIIAAILAWFLGIFGIHRFYLGQTGMGIGYLLGTITIFGVFITGIISFVDFVGLLIMPQETFDRRYNPQLYYGKDTYNTGALGMGTPTTVNIADELHKLDILFQRGIITFEEFEKRKARLLNS
jgi:TM2 domain-containing membrane protein YozV